MYIDTDRTIRSTRVRGMYEPKYVFPQTITNYFWILNGAKKL